MWIKIFTKQELILGVIGREAGCSLHELTVCCRGTHRERNKLSFWKMLMRWLQGWPYIPCWQFIGGCSWATLGGSTPEQVRLRAYETTLPNPLCTYSCLVLHAVGLMNRGFGFCLCCMHACIYHVLFLHFIIIALNLTSRINEVTLFCHIVDAVGIVCGLRLKWILGFIQRRAASLLMCHCMNLTC